MVDQQSTTATTESGIIVAAHRGASDGAPDNSHVAFSAAIEQRADLIETDVRMSSDGILLLEHDSEIHGLEVQLHPFRTLLELKPSLVTVAAALRNYGSSIPFIWEIKQPGIEHSVVQLVRDTVPTSIWQRTEFISFFPPSTEALMRAAPEATVGLLTYEWSVEIIEKATSLGVTQICPRATAVEDRPELVEFARQRGLEVRVWLVEAPGQVNYLRTRGVSGVTVDFPGRAREALGATR